MYITYIYILYYIILYYIILYIIWYYIYYIYNYMYVCIYIYMIYRYPYTKNPGHFIQIPKKWPLGSPAGSLGWPDASTLRRSQRSLNGPRFGLQHQTRWFFGKKKLWFMVDISWYIIVYHDIYIYIYHYMSWYITIYHVICHDTSIVHDLSMVVNQLGTSGS